MRLGTEPRISDSRTREELSESGEVCDKMQSTTATKRERNKLYLWQEDWSLLRCQFFPSDYSFKAILSKMLIVLFSFVGKAVRGE